MLSGGAAKRTFFCKRLENERVPIAIDQPSSFFFFLLMLSWNMSNQTHSSLAITSLLGVGFCAVKSRFKRTRSWFLLKKLVFFLVDLSVKIETSSRSYLVKLLQKKETWKKGARDRVYIFGVTWLLAIWRALRLAAAGPPRFPTSQVRSLFDLLKISRGLLGSWQFHFQDTNCPNPAIDHDLIV